MLAYPLGTCSASSIKDGEHWESKRVRKGDRVQEDGVNEYLGSWTRSLWLAIEKNASTYYRNSKCGVVGEKLLLDCL